MKCPYCTSTNTNVKDSRETDNGDVIRRRRICPKCNGRFTTFERMQLRQLIVVKRSGKKKPYDRHKIFKSITTALRKRDITEEKIEQINDKICMQIESTTSREIDSRTIGKLIMNELAKVDQVAYIRFASVYKDFTNAQDFARFISKLKK